MGQRAAKAWGLRSVQDVRELIVRRVCGARCREGEQDTRRRAWRVEVRYNSRRVGGRSKVHAQHLGRARCRCSPWATWPRLLGPTAIRFRLR